MKTVEVSEITEKDHTFRGRLIKGRVLEGLQATVVVGQSIRIYGTYANHIAPHFSDRTFVVGDEAEYNSYNLSLIGKIVAITEKTVTIEESDRPGPLDYQAPRTRLQMYDFCWRNWDFDATKKHADNAERMMSL